MIYYPTNMEFLDPVAERRSRVMLFIGYGLIAIAITIASLILWYWSYGFTLSRDGEVKQNGLVFVSSTPQGATITLNGETSTERTNGRLSLESGSYDMKVSLEGYRDWTHSFSVEGSDVQRFDYLKLIPTQLKSSVIAPLATEPSFVSQSPNKRWLVAKDATITGLFQVYDLRNPKKPNVIQLTLPETIVSASETTTSWKVVEWSNDNRHLLLSHTFVTEATERKEYILFDRTSAELGRNLTTQLQFAPEESLQLYDKQFDQLYVHNAANNTLRTLSVSGAEIIPPTEKVIAFKTYGRDTLLYVTETAAADGALQRSAILKTGNQQITLRQFALPTDNTNYLLDVARYDNDWYVVTGETTGKGVYVYKNPFEQKLLVDVLPKPWRYLRRDSPTKVSFSNNARFLLVQSNQKVTVCDIEEVAIRSYAIDQPLDIASELRWVDSFHLAYVSGGKVQLMDYDKHNHQVLTDSNPRFTPYFAPDSRFMLTITAGNNGTGASLTTTPLIVEKV